MRLTGEMICDNFQIIRCFDFLNHIDNMRPFAEVALSRQGRGLRTRHLDVVGQRL